MSFSFAIQKGNIFVPVPVNVEVCKTNGHKNVDCCKIGVSGDINDDDDDDDDGCGDDGDQDVANDDDDDDDDGGGDDADDDEVNADDGDGHRQARLALPRLALPPAENLASLPGSSSSNYYYYHYYYIFKSQLLLLLFLLCLPLRILRVSLAVQVPIIRPILIFRPMIILVPIMKRKFIFLLLTIFSTFSECSSVGSLVFCLREKYI